MKQPAPTGSAKSFNMSEAVLRMTALTSVATGLASVAWGFTHLRADAGALPGVDPLPEDRPSINVNVARDERPTLDDEWMKQQLVEAENAAETEPEVAPEVALAPPATPGWASTPKETKFTPASPTGLMAGLAARQAEALNNPAANQMPELATQQPPKTTQPPKPKAAKSPAPKSNAAEFQEPGTSALIAQLRSGDEAKQRVAIRSIRRQGAFSPAVVSALVETANNGSTRTRQSVVTLLGSAAKSSPEALDAVIAALDAKEESVRWRAVSVLGQLKPNNRVVGAITAALNDSAEGVRNHAALALSDLGSAASSAAPALITMMQTGRASHARSYAASALGSIGGPVQSVVPALIDALEDPSRTVRDNASFSIAEIGDDAVPILEDVLQSSGASLRRDVESILKTIRTPLATRAIASRPGA